MVGLKSFIVVPCSFSVRAISRSTVGRMTVVELSFIDPPLGGFCEILPEVMKAPWEISSLRVIFRRIPRVEGL